MTRLTEIEQIGSSYVDRLEAAGLDSIEAFLATCRTPQGRTELARRTGISENLLLGWAQRAELSHVEELSEEFADLMEAAGVGGLLQLSEYSPRELLNLLAETNEVRQIVRELPDLGMVANWIGQANSLPRLLEY